MKLLILLSILLTCLSLHANLSKRAKTNYVPDKATAMKIAEAIWFPIFRDTINNYKPFSIHLQGDTLWIVSGYRKELSLGGGQPFIELRKSDCQVLVASRMK